MGRNDTGEGTVRECGTDMSTLCMRACSVTAVSDSLRPYGLARQTPLSMGFSRQGYWSVLPFPPPGDLPDSETEAGSPALKADSLLSEAPGVLIQWDMTQPSKRRN